MVQFAFNASKVKPETGIPDPLPNGWYRAIIDGSELKPTKDGEGLRLNLTFKVIEGFYSGQLVFEGLNVRNKNEQAQTISLARLSAICHAIGILDVQDTNQLHDKPMNIKVKFIDAADGYEAKNEIKAIKNVNSEVDLVLTKVAVQKTNEVVSTTSTEQPSWAQQSETEVKETAVPTPQHQPEPEHQPAITETVEEDETPPWAM